MVENRPSGAPMRVVRGLRRIVADRLGRMIDWRIVHPLEGNRLYRLYGTVDEQERQLRELRESRDDLGRRLGDLERRFTDMAKLQRWSAGELERIIPQIASQESQLESLREKLTAVPAAEGPELAESRSLIEEIRREHSQVRVRLTAVAQYEDRLRKLEDRTQ